MLKGEGMKKDNVLCNECKHFRPNPESHFRGRCIRYPDPQPDKSEFDTCGESEPR